MLIIQTPPTIPDSVLRRQASQHRPIRACEAGRNEHSVVRLRPQVVSAGDSAHQYQWDGRFYPMQRNRVTVFCQGIAACALWACGLWMQQSAALAQTSQDTQAEKTSKAKKSKKSASDATSKQPTTPAAAGEKAPKAKKSKEPAGEAISPQSAAPPVAGEKTPAPRKPKKSGVRFNFIRVCESSRDWREQTGSAAPVRNASRTEIQSARTGGQVWVNTDSGVYHKSGRWYGATKQGKFMTEQEAVRAGYKASKERKVGQLHGGSRDSAYPNLDTIGRVVRRVAGYGRGVYRLTCQARPAPQRWSVASVWRGPSRQ